MIFRGAIYLVNRGANSLSFSTWLTYLVTEYGVSADWLLTGRGSIMR